MDTEKLKLLCDAVRGLEYLHSLEPAIVHGSIKPENVLVKDNLEAALCDFGVSRIPLAIGDPCWRSTSTLGYQAKEVIQGGPLTIAVDVYALGGLILAAMSGKDPFWEKSDDAKTDAVLGHQIPAPALHHGLSNADPLWGLLRECWSPKPEERPTAEIVLQKLESEIEGRNYHEEALEWCLEAYGIPRILRLDRWSSSAS
ncbi:hypothetical protein FRC00_005833 [Tulasnella sp. 408]|nr:hypothetical protein FRC00_005833 [Tulasnella sp. 408]